MDRIDSLLKKVLDVTKSIERVHYHYDKLCVDLELNKKKDRDNQELESLMLRSKDAYKLVVDEVYSRHMGEINDVLNDGLKFIFYDKNYSVKIDITDFKNKTLEFFLYDEDYDPPRLCSISSGVGNGVRTVVSFILLAYYIISLDRKRIIFSDEAYSGISESYVDRFFTFVKAFCNKKGLKFILITHDNRFLDYGDKKYVVSEGVVMEKTENG